MHAFVSNDAVRTCPGFESRGPSTRIPTRGRPAPGIESILALRAPESRRRKIWVDHDPGISDAGSRVFHKNVGATQSATARGNVQCVFDVSADASPDGERQGLGRSGSGSRRL